MLKKSQLEGVSIKNLEAQRANLFERLAQKGEKNFHLAQYYEDEKFFAESVAIFVSASLQKGGGALIVARRELHKLLKENIEKEGVELPLVVAEQRLVFWDSAETLRNLLVFGKSDREKFSKYLGTAIEDMLAKFSTLHVFGDMVDSLWKSGNVASSIELENCWCDLMKTHPFSLFCGYAINKFGPNFQRDIQSINETHSHVLPRESQASKSDIKRELRSFVFFEQQAQSLQTEIARRQGLENQLKEAHSRIAEMEGLHQALLKNSADCIQLLDLEGTILSMNHSPGGEYPSSVGTSWFHYWCADDLAPLKIAFSAAREGESGECVAELPDRQGGKPGFWRLTTSPIRDSAGKVERVLAVARKITGPLKIQEFIRESQRRQSDETFRLMIESVKDYAIFKLDPKGRVATWNEGAKRFKGYEADEILGQHFSKFYPPEDKNWKPKMELEVASRTGRFEDEGWRIRKDGSRFWANVIITALRDKDQNLVGFAKVTRDLTERKAAEEARVKLESQKAELKAAERERDRLYSLFMQVPTPICIYRTSEHVIELFNPAARDLIGGRDPTGLPVRRGLPEFENGGLFEILDEVYRKGETRFVTARRVSFNLPDGNSREHYFNVVYQPWFEKDGKVGGVLSLNLDVTAQVTALKNRDEFLSIASHELKTPITSLKMQIQMAEKRLKNPSEEIDTDKLARALEVSDRQVDRLVSLIEGLLDLTRIQSGKLSYNFEKTNFSDLVNEVRERFEQPLTAAKTELVIHVDRDLTGTWDKARLEQVLINLITNSIKYAPGSPIVISAKKERQGAIIAVQDFGAGIPREKREKIFDRFERIGDKNVSGLGLGLYISKQIIRAHGGAIELDPHVENGAKFVITLPLDSRAYQSTATLATSAASVASPSDVKGHPLSS